MKYLSLFFLVFIYVSCKKEVKPNRFSANVIINKSIEVSGGELIKNSTIEFDFRDKHYKAIRKEGEFILERVFTDKTNKYFDTITQITDAINNKGFQRFVNNFPMSVLDSMAVKYSASVNSVHYFSVLPHGLNGKAVHKTYLEQTKVKDIDCHKIEITFSEEGGGEDFEDVFIYWINTQTFKADYIAYSYNEDDGLGLRFREAYNERYINGIRFVDYKNYKPINENATLENLDSLFEAGSLSLLSKIELKNISVNIL